MPQKPRDATEILAERVDGFREAHLDVVREAFKRLAVYAPESMLARELALIEASANEFGWDCERAGEQYRHDRPTRGVTPPDPDKAPRRRASWDDELTPVVTAQERVRRGR